LTNNDGTKSHSTTIDFKFGVLEAILRTFTGIRGIELFDDRSKHIVLFSKAFERLKSQSRIQYYTTNHVEIPKHEDMEIDSDLEIELVKDMIQNVNARIEACKTRDSRNISSSSIDLSSESNIVTKSQVPRRVSISNFRNEIILKDYIYYTGIMLDRESRLLLSQLYPCPNGWKLKSSHMTISFGNPNEKIVQFLGGIGAKKTMIATHYGMYEDKCVALKIDPTGLQSAVKVMHITLFISPNGLAHLSNLITNWKPLSEPIKLTGVVNHKVRYGLARSDAKSPPVKSEISIGNLVKARFPELKGKEIGIVTHAVHEWMEKGFVENIQSNHATIEWYIQSLDVQALLESNTNKE
jgi:hypothetical protein